MQSAVHDLNVESARLARAACDAAEAKDGRVRLVAGGMGPTTKLLSLSPDVSDPAYRDCDFDTMARAYKQQALGLMEGGADLLLIETITDTLNCKAALWGAWEAFDETGIEPLSAPLTRHVHGGPQAIRAEEDFDGLRQAADPRQQHDFFPLQPARRPSPVPVLVQLVNGTRRGIRQLQHPRDFCTPLAPYLGDLAGALRTHSRHRRQLQQFFHR